MQALYGCKDREAGPAMEQHVRLYLSALTRLTNTVTALCAVFVASIAVLVLSRWTPLDLLTSLAGWAWWISLIAMLSFPFWGRSRISNMLQRRQLLREAVETADFVPEQLPKPGQQSKTEIIRQL